LPRRKEDAKIMITDEEERIAKIIVNSAYQVHKKLGPGLLEKIYEACLAYELEKAGLKVKRQIDLPIIYDELYFDEGLRLDLYVEESIIIEIKAVDIVNPIWKAQLISHLKLTQNQLGFLINFNVPLIKDGIKRYIYTKNY
jgi:GxxExxY protein